MSCIVKQKVGNHIYLYESISYRNKDGKPRNKRTPIGKIDLITGQPKYKPEYLDRMAANKIKEITIFNLTVIVTEKFSEPN